MCWVEDCPSLPFGCALSVSPSRSRSGRRHYNSQAEKTIKRTNEQRPVVLLGLRTTKCRAPTATRIGEVLEQTNKRKNEQRPAVLLGLETSKYFAPTATRIGKVLGSCFWPRACAVFLPATHSQAPRTPFTPARRFVSYVLTPTNVSRLSPPCCAAPCLRS